MDIAPHTPKKCCLCGSTKGFADRTLDGREIERWFWSDDRKHHFWGPFCCLQHRAQWEAKGHVVQTADFESIFGSIPRAERLFDAIAHGFYGDEGPGINYLKVSREKDADGFYPFRFDDMAVLLCACGEHNLYPSTATNVLCYSCHEITEIKR